MEMIYLEITHKAVYSHPPAEYIHWARIVMKVNIGSTGYQFDFQVLFVFLKTAVVANDQEFSSLCDGMLSSNGFFAQVLDYINNYLSVVRFHTS